MIARSFISSLYSITNCISNFTMKQQRVESLLARYLHVNFTPSHFYYISTHPHIATQHEPSLQQSATRGMYEIPLICVLLRAHAQLPLIATSSLTQFHSNVNFCTDYLVNILGDYLHIFNSTVHCIYTSRFIKRRSTE